MNINTNDRPGTMEQWMIGSAATAKPNHREREDVPEAGEYDRQKRRDHNANPLLGHDHAPDQINPDAKRDHKGEHRGRNKPRGELHEEVGGRAALDQAM